MVRRLSELEGKRIQNCKTWSHFANYALLIGPSAFVVSITGFLSFKLESWKIVFWKLHFVYSTILTAIFTTIMIYSAYVFNITYTSRGNANILHTNFLMSLGLVVFLVAYASNPSMTKAIQSVSESSRVIPPKIFRKLTKIIYIKDILLIMPLLGFVITLFRYYYNSPFLLISYTFTGILSLNNLYTNNVYVLSACFQQINESLKKVKEMLLNDEPHLLRRVFHEQKNPMLLTILRSQKNQHLEFSKTVHKLNSAFSTQMEASLFLLLIDITFNIYSYLVTYGDDRPIKKFGYDIIFAVLYVIHMVLIILIVDIARSEMEKIGWNIHRILIHTSDEKMTTELKMFSLQVLQRGNKFTMKAIVLHFPYLTQIVCGITTFLLILIQFLVDKPC